jgi:hypothetical protein
MDNTNIELVDETTEPQETEQMNYNSVVSVLRTIARDWLRMEKTNRVKDQILEYKTKISSLEKSVKDYEKQIEIEKFDLSEIKDNNPRKEELVKIANENMKFLFEKIDERNKDIKDVQTCVDDRTKELDIIQAGTWKADREELSNRANKLIEVYAKTAAEKAS